MEGGASPWLPAAPLSCCASKALNGAAPPLREGRDRQSAAQARGSVSGQVEQGADLAHAHLLWPDGDPLDLVSRAHLTLLEHPHVEAGPSVRVEQCRHARLLQAQADLEAGDARLGDLEGGVADPVAVSDADLLVGQTFDGEVLAEVAGDEVVAAEHLRPVLIGRPVIHVDGPVLAAMADEVGLAVAVHVQPPHPASARNRGLEDRRPHGTATPRHLPRKPDVHREQPHGACRVACARRHRQLAAGSMPLDGQHWPGAPPRRR